jgi:hypothetical protein
MKEKKSAPLGLIQQGRGDRSKPIRIEQDSNVGAVLGELCV